MNYSLYIHVQLLVFCLALLVGVGAAFWFDLLRAWCWVTRPGRALLFMADLGFVLAAGALFLGVLFAANHGELRGYTVVGFGLGALIYRWLASPVVVIAASHTLRFTLGVCHRALSPFRALSKLFSRKHRELEEQDSDDEA